MANQQETFVTSFELRGPPREVNDASVTVLDEALAASLGGAPVLHAYDPRRLLTFEAGGPPVWSVGVASNESGLHQYLTYGLSRVVEPARSFGFELTMRVRSAGEPPMWPTLLLRSIARYHLTSGRTIEPGQFLDMAGPISQAPVAPAERHLMPTTRMDTIMIARGAMLETPHGSVEIRNVIGLDADERELLECSRAETFLRELAKLDPSYTVDLESKSLAGTPAFAEAMMEASRAEGSDCGALCVPGLRWTDDGRAFRVVFPAGSGPRLARRIASRFPFRQGLLVHADEGGPGTEVLLLPGDELDAEPVGARLALRLPRNSPYLFQLGVPEALEWSFRYA